MKGPASAVSVHQRRVNVAWRSPYSPGPRLSLPSVSPKYRARCVTINGTVPFACPPSSPANSLNASLSLLYSKAAGASPITTLSNGREGEGKSSAAEGESKYNGLAQQRQTRTSDRIPSMKPAPYLRLRFRTSSAAAESEVKSCGPEGSAFLMRTAQTLVVADLFFTNVELHLGELVKQRRPCENRQASAQSACELSRR